MLSSEKISGQLHTKWAARNILYKEITGSTNTDARELAKEGAPEGTLVVADRQDAGRGSNGRGWETPAGSNIAMSLVVRPKVGPERISMLTLVMGLSVAEGIELALSETHGDQGGMDAADAGKQEKDCIGMSADNACRIKWPNDVVIGGKKVCGILTELHMAPGGAIEDAIVGVGINVNMVDFPEDIKGVAGSLLTQTGKRVDRSLVVARVMERFEENYGEFEKTFDLSLLKAQYEKRLINKDHRVMILDPHKAGAVDSSQAVDEKFEGLEKASGESGVDDERQPGSGDALGVAVGITDLGALLVKMDDGAVGEVMAGEVSVRGIYGYV